MTCENVEEFISLLVAHKLAGRAAGPLAALGHYDRVLGATAKLGDVQNYPLVADVRSIRYLPDGSLTAKVQATALTAAILITRPPVPWHHVVCSCFVPWHHVACRALLAGLLNGGRRAPVRHRPTG